MQSAGAMVQETLGGISCSRSGAWGRSGEPDVPITRT